MSAKNPAKRAEELRGELARHDHRYYVVDDPEIGDDAYDALVDELRALEEEHPELRTPESPTQRVGGQPLGKFQQVRHGEPMFSLANARSREEFRAWETRLHNRLRQLDIEPGELRFVSEPKIDGLAISLTYEDGIFTRGAIRHFFFAGEMLGPILLSLHNIRFYQRLMVDIRQAIGPLLSGLEEAKADIVGMYGLKWLVDHRALPKERLAEFHRVENTYLSTFQTLGGLGLLVGTVGLAAVLLRNVLERQRELALLGAVGYGRLHIFTIVVAENLLLLAWGLAIGTVCAVMAIAPAVSERGGRLPATAAGALLLVAVSIAGLLSSVVATRVALRRPLVDALRSE